MNMYAGVPASAKEKCCAPFNREPRRLTIFALSQGHVLKSDVLKKIRAADDVHGKSVSFSARRAALPDQSRITLRIDILALPAGCGRGRQLMLPPEHFHIENL